MTGNQCKELQTGIQAFAFFSIF